MENGVTALPDAEILAGAVRTFETWESPSERGVGYAWPDGFRFGSWLDERCDEAKAERDAIRVRREYLRRKGLAHAG
jgi:hypothetical protein